MQNYIQDGDTIEMTAPYALLSGQGALVGGIFGIALGNIANGARGQFKRTGVVSHAKVSAQAWTEGEPVYWDNTNRVMTDVASGNKLVGAAAAPAANPTATGLVLLMPTAI